MKKTKNLFWKIAGAIIGIVILVIIGFGIYLKTALPNIPLEDITVNITPERVERGAYLANHVMVCIDCHSERDYGKFSGPIVEGTEGGGGEAFTEELGFPGNYYASNITPFNLKPWTDGEIYRAITAGVTKENAAMFPIMPYHSYGVLDREDIYCVIAYLRTLPEVENTTPESESGFPMSFIINLIPKQGVPVTRPDTSDLLRYGEYVTTAGGCKDCHTQMEKGKFVPGMEFGGGQEFPLEDIYVTSANITPDKATGIGNWTEDAFIARFTAYDLATYTPHEVPEGGFNTIMPWTMYAGMDTTDLQAIYSYLMSVKPIENRVVMFREK
ncbi:MAG: c-type cytochrome [Bacteroidales bacterium]|nr:c-type cytochrome [Bacteroidales bacterium]